MCIVWSEREIKWYQMLVVYQIFSSCNCHQIADFAQREFSKILWESLAVLSRFERARSHDVNDPTHLIISDFKYLRRTTLSCRLISGIWLSLWSLSFSLVIFQIQIKDSLLKDMLEGSWHNLERSTARTGNFSSALKHCCLKSAVVDPFQKTWKETLYDHELFNQIKEFFSLNIFLFCTLS